MSLKLYLFLYMYSYREISLAVFDRRTIELLKRVYLI